MRVTRGGVAPEMKQRPTSPDWVGFGCFLRLAGSQLRAWHSPRGLQRLLAGETTTTRFASVVARSGVAAGGLESAATVPTWIWKYFGSGRAGSPLPTREGRASIVTLAQSSATVSTGLGGERALGSFGHQKRSGFDSRVEYRRA
ncbi:unnamed protein product [Cuscuta epithymum]|uniref:Uncharacterized protein n=1 Tax=Cuscuta epithymum TaxID=186058 RepID=A0AAV0E176_9ASTE|nr:unnamed protein product [Cuscuta epithymum]